jgi:hypothetical protein
MRLWRTLKGLGCATLRDGVYLLPDSPEHAQALKEAGAIAVEVEGSAEIYRLGGRDDAQDAALRALFDRSGDYADLIGEVRELRSGLGRIDQASAGRKLHAFARRYEQIARLDFFPGEPQRRALDLLEDLRRSATRHFSPEEPVSVETPVPRLDRASYQGRTWATRARPWVDRLASAWLIRHHIDPQAHLVWLAKPADCKKAWLGFDFDGAAFSHVGSRVTFEVLAASFGLDDDPAIARLGAVVHCLDVGGVPVPEAAGIEAVLAGLRAAIADDDQLLDEAGRVFHGLYRHFNQENIHD